MQYFRFTNKEETCEGQKLKSGLNVLKEPFSSSIIGAGIAYREASKLLYSYSADSYWMREVKIPEDAQYVNTREDMGIWKADKVILGRRVKVTFDVMKDFIKEHKIDIHADEDHLLCPFEASGNLEMIDYLLSKGLDVNNTEGFGLWCVAQSGNTEVMKYLISKGADVKNNRILTFACNKGNIDMVKLLVSNGAIITANSLQLSGIKGCQDIYEYLASKVDIKVTPKKKNSNARKEKNYTLCDVVACV